MTDPSSPSTHHHSMYFAEAFLRANIEWAQRPLDDHRPWHVFVAESPFVVAAVEEARKEGREKAAQEIEAQIAEMERPNAYGLIHACEELRLMVAVARGSVPVKEHSTETKGETS